MAKATAPAKSKTRKQGAPARRDKQTMKAARADLARCKLALLEARKTNRAESIRAAAAAFSKADAAIKALNRARFKKLVDERGLAVLRASDFLCKLFAQSRYTQILTDEDEAAIIGALQGKLDLLREAFRAARERQKVSDTMETTAPLSLFTDGDTGGGAHANL